MTLSNKLGPVNVVESLIYTLSSQLPGKVAAYNAANSASVCAYLAGPYVLSVDKTLQVSLNKATEITCTVAAGTYTATTLAAALNGDVTFSGGGLTATTAMGGAHLVIYTTTRGAAGSIKLGDGTINSILGLADDTIHNWFPLRNVAYYGVMPDAMDNGFVAGYPALLFRMPDSGDDTSEGGGIRMVAYDVEMRLYATADTHDFKDTLYYQLGHMVELIRTVLRDTDNVSLGGQVNWHGATSVKFARDVEALGGRFRHWLDFSMTVKVQEDN